MLSGAKKLSSGCGIEGPFILVVYAAPRVRPDEAKRNPGLAHPPAHVPGFRFAASGLRYVITRTD
jgi:hypothetical protein